jgi:hypothetical protein
MSPCTGKVLEVRNDAPDLIPPYMDSENPEGALLCVKKQSFIGTYAKRKYCSERKFRCKGRTTDRTKLGIVTHRSLICISMLKIDGKGVPIKLNGKFLLRNNIVRVR